MNCNKYSTWKIQPDRNTQANNRGKLDTGTFCNYNCEFCYYKDQLDVTTDVQTIKDRADLLKQYGIKQVDLSGGESSIHKNWFEILQYCNERFEHISTLSNGWAFAKEDFLLKSKQSGLKEIMFSLHGWDEQSHDEIVGRKGSWEKILKAINLCKKHNIVVRINCTVYQKNYASLDQYCSVIKSIKPLELNFLTLNYWTNNKHAAPIDYNVVTDHIKKCIDSVKEHVKYINVRYTPYCYMKGYEKYVCNQYQHIYDLYDWNKAIYEYDVDTTIKYTEDEKLDMSYNKARSDRLQFYKKPLSCIRCKHFFICDGIEHQVKCKVKPERGDYITDVNHYRKNFYK